MRNIYLLLIIAVLSSCKKDVCTICTYSITAINTSTDEIAYSEEGTYSEEEEEAGCEMTTEDYQNEKESELTNTIDYENALNPIMELDPETGDIDFHDEVYTYTLNCK
jgi:hypothetical protein